MSEGGFLLWKRQKIKRFGPTADYSGIKNPLPDPPKGKVWYQNKETKEWSLITEGEEPELQVETNDVPVVEGVPVEDSKATEEEGEWDLLSDKISIGSVGGGGVFVNRSGSVCSITSFTSNNSSCNLSTPFRVHRTYSSSTIDSTDGNHVGGGVLGVDYVDHVVLPSDTLQGLCLAYKISATRIRQVNHFSGNSLLLAPKKLIIPMTIKAMRSGQIFVQDKESKEFKLSAFRADCPDMSLAEAKAYLELSDWDLHGALSAAREDFEWEKGVADQSQPSGGDIRITVKQKGLTTIGAGIQPRAPKPASNVDTVIYEGVPAIATKTVTPKDVYNAAAQHDGFGVEMQPLIKSSNSNREEIDGMKSA